MLAHDLDRDAGRGGDALGIIGAVREGRPDERPEAARRPQERAGPIREGGRDEGPEAGRRPRGRPGPTAVLKGGGMGKEQQPPPARAPQRGALAALHFLSGIIASWTAALGGLDRLAVEDGRARAR